MHPSSTPLPGETLAVQLDPRVQRLVTLGRLPSDNEPWDQTVVARWVAALDALDRPLTDDEAIAVLDSFPADDSTVEGVAWSLLHAIESAPYGPRLVAALDDRSWWVKYLRERSERGGRA